ncbi:MAG: hypothetical protein AAFX07_00550 [Pseudomonadota bacterium]
MTRFTARQDAFNSGEMSPLLYARVQYQRNLTGCEKMRGYLPLRQGGFTLGPGTLFRGYTDGNVKGRLVNFEFAENDAVILEFTPLKMRVWRYGSLIESGGAPYEIATPYDDDAIERLVWEQSADVIYMADGVLPMQKLSRFALDNWTIAPAAFNTGPFRVQNLDETLTLQSNLEQGSATLTASRDFFEQNHEGSLIQLSPVDYSIPIWTSNTAVSVGDQWRNGGNIYELISGDDSGANAPVHTEGAQRVNPGGAVWEFVSDGTGIVRVAEVTSPTEAICDVIKRLPRGVVDAPTYRFAEGAWSNRYGYPSALEIYDQRLVAAATPTEPRTLWFSTGGAPEDFEPSTEADGSFAYAISGENSLNRILWLASGAQGLHIGALGEEYVARSTDGNVIIGPTTTAFDRVSSIGSANIRPIAPDGWPIFIAKDGARVFDLRYSLERDAVQSREISLASEHLGASGFKDIAWQSAPLRIAWLRLGNGELAALVHEPTEEILGWAPYPVAGGVVESIAIAPSADAATDVLTMIVRREIGGQTVRTIEEQALTFGVLSGAQSIYEAVHFFSAVVFVESDATDTFAVPHLAGAEAYAWTDQGTFGPFTVGPAGEVTLDTAVTRATIGLFDDTHACRPRALNPPSPAGDTLARPRRLHAPLAVQVHQTAGGKVRAIERDIDGERPGDLISLLDQQVAQEPAQAFSGVREVELYAGNASEVLVEYVPDPGVPMTILAQAATIEEGG